MNLIENVGMHLSGLEQLRQIMGDGHGLPIGDTLDFGAVEFRDGMAVFEGIPSPRVYNPIGTVHGGFAATMLDSALACAVHTKLQPGWTYTTLELKVLYHKGITSKTGRVRAEGRVMSFGRRAAFAEGLLKDEAGTVYASATSSLLVMAPAPKP